MCNALISHNFERSSLEHILHIYLITKINEIDNVIIIIL